MSTALDKLDPALQWAVSTGLMTLAQAQDVEALADGLVERVARGELTRDEASEFATAQGESDGLARLRARKAKDSP